ncbi:MAG TPA: UDP-N-acetylmuramate--L-alanine ligase [Cyclobacteriaceae bacterium]|nr:UDP-N-acetylmuramate--L-alanine ligase [Cyclobacteriaceae bacterium]
MFDNKHIVYFLGIGGIGMSALARWFYANGKKVYGYDRTETRLTQQLSAEGMHVNYTDNAEIIPKDIRENAVSSLIVNTPAVPKDCKQLNFFIDHGFEIRKRSEVLGMITRDHFNIAVAGTHGKTTTSSMIAHILNTTGHKMTAFLGGIMQNYETNLIMDIQGKGDLMVVVEADEYDRSFHQLSPDIAVITAADPDHLDIYGTEAEMRKAYSQFIGKIRHNGMLIIKKGLTDLVPDNRADLQVMEYNLIQSNIRAGNIRMDREEMRFDFISPDIEISNIPLSQPGHHNIENAIAAVAASLAFGANEQHIKEAFSTYRGVKRRFEYIIHSPELVFIDDYAHHPSEISAFLGSLKAIYSGRHITVIFQPHLFSRTRDMAEEFAESLSVADDILLLEIYPARELPIAGVTSGLIFDKLKTVSKSLVKMDDVTGIIKDKKIEVLATLGAGDIDKIVSPIREILLKKS